MRNKPNGGYAAGKGLLQPSSLHWWPSVGLHCPRWGRFVYLWECLVAMMRILTFSGRRGGGENRVFWNVQAKKYMGNLSRVLDQILELTNVAYTYIIFQLFVSDYVALLAGAGGAFIGDFCTKICSPSQTTAPPRQCHHGLSGALRTSVATLSVLSLQAHGGWHFPRPIWLVWANNPGVAVCHFWWKF